MTSSSLFPWTPGTYSASEAARYVMYEKRIDRRERPIRKRRLLSVFLDSTCHLSGIEFFTRSPLNFFYQPSSAMLAARFEAEYSRTAIVWPESVEDLCVDLSGRVFQGQYRYTDRCLYQFCALRFLTPAGRLVVESEFLPFQGHSSAVVVPAEFVSIFNAVLRLSMAKLDRVAFLVHTERQSLLWPFSRRASLSKTRSVTLERFFRSLSRFVTVFLTLAAEYGYQPAFWIDASGFWCGVLYSPVSSWKRTDSAGRSYEFYPALVWTFSLSRLFLSVAPALWSPQFPASVIPLPDLPTLRREETASRLLDLKSFIPSDKSLQRRLDPVLRYLSPALREAFSQGDPAPETLLRAWDSPFSAKVARRTSLFRYVGNHIFGSMFALRLRDCDRFLDWFANQVYLETALLAPRRYLSALLSYAFADLDDFKTGFDLVVALLEFQNDVLFSSSCFGDFFLYLLVLKPLIAFSLKPEILRRVTLYACRH